MLSVAVIGAGPHALSFVGQLVEESPDTSGDFFVGLSSHPVGNTVSREKCFAPRDRRAVKRIMSQVAVVDPAGRWMAQWDAQFRALNIPHLRSSYDLHPATWDSFALEGFVEKQGREGELTDLEFIDNDTKYRQGNFRVPNRRLFLDFCRHVVSLYGLEDSVIAARALRIEPVFAGANCEADVEVTTSSLAALELDHDAPAVPEPRRVAYFRVHLSSGAMLCARRVVVAAGSTGVRRVPMWAEEWIDAGGGRSDCSNRAAHVMSVPPPPPMPTPTPPRHTIMHAWDIVDELRDTAGVPTSSGSRPAVSATASTGSLGAIAVGLHGGTASEPMRGESLLVVGGGLTSAHLVKSAYDAGCRDITLLARNELRVKQFDLTLDWMGWRHRPNTLSNFIGERSLERRLGLIREARGGGSVSPEAMCTLRALRAQGHLRVMEEAEVISAEWCEEDDDEGAGDAQLYSWRVFIDGGGVGSVEDEPRVASAPLTPGAAPSCVASRRRRRRRRAAGREYKHECCERFDRIWLATGSCLDVDADPLLRQLLRDVPIKTVGGLPALHPSLAWRRNCACFVLGAMAAIQLGPDALNLAGGRAGACRIGWMVRSAVREEAAAAAATAEHQSKWLDNADQDEWRFDAMEALRVSYNRRSGTVSVSVSNAAAPASAATSATSVEADSVTEEGGDVIKKGKLSKRQRQRARRLAAAARRAKRLTTGCDCGSDAC